VFDLNFLEIKEEEYDAQVGADNQEILFEEEKQNSQNEQINC
jgi:hypothetical protein